MKRAINFCSSESACRHLDKYGEPEVEYLHDPKLGFCPDCFAVVVVTELNKAAAALFDQDEEGNSAYALDEGLTALDNPVSIEDAVAHALRAKWQADHLRRLNMRAALRNAGAAAKAKGGAL